MKTTKDLRDFDSLFQLLDHFTTEEICEEHLAVIRWNGEPTCPYCESTRVNSLKGATKRYKCYGCRKQFGVKVGTIFHKSPISLRKWFVAIYIITAHKKGISSCQLAKDLKITQKSAWFVLQRIRETYNVKAEKFNTTVEIDETYIGGKETNKHQNKKAANPYTGTKIPVLGILERDGKVYAVPVKNKSSKQLLPIMVDTVEAGTTVYTDEWKAYTPLAKNFDHSFVCHKANQYVSGSVHTNGIENFWSLLKRGIDGIYHQVSEQHLHRYVNEFTFRFNNRDLSEGSKFDVALANGTNKRLDYKTLING